MANTKKIEQPFTFKTSNDDDRFETDATAEVRMNGKPIHPSDVPVGAKCDLLDGDGKWWPVERTENSEFTMRMNHQIQDLCASSARLLFSVGSAEAEDGKLRFVENDDKPNLEDAWVDMYDKLVALKALQQEANGGAMFARATGKIWQHIHEFVKACGGDLASKSMRKYSAHDNLDKCLAMDRKDPNSVPHAERGKAT